MAKTKATGLRRIFNAFFYSVDGLKAAFKHEAAFRQELLLIIPLHILAFYYAKDLAVLLILLILPYLTIVFELVNSAIEAVVDRISDDYHELSKRAKDIGSACVLIFLIITFIAHAIVILDYYKFISFT